MKNTRKMVVGILVFAFLVASFGCGKEGFQIGHENPQMEIQKCLKLSDKKKFEEAVECLEVFKSRFPQSPYSTEAELSIGDTYFDKKEYLMAADSYKAFLTLHPTSPKADYATYRLGLSYFKESPKAIDRDQQYLDDAIKYLGAAVVAFPGSRYSESAKKDLLDAKTRLAKRSFYIGSFYFKTREYKASLQRFSDVVNLFPETDLVPEALYKLVLASGYLRRIDDAKTYYSKLSTSFPGSDWTKKAESELTDFVKRYGNGEDGGNK